MCLNKFKQDFFSCLDKLFQDLKKNQEKHIIFTDAYQDDRFLGASGGIIEACFYEKKLNNMEILHHNEIQKKHVENSIFVIFCELTNKNNTTEVSLTTQPLNNFFSTYNNDCYCIFANVPFKEERNIFIFELPMLICEYMDKNF